MLTPTESVQLKHTNSLYPIITFYFPKIYFYQLINKLRPVYESIHPAYLISQPLIEQRGFVDVQANVKSAIS